MASPGSALQQLIVAVAELGLLRFVVLALADAKITSRHRDAIVLLKAMIEETHKVGPLRPVNVVLASSGRDLHEPWLRGARQRRGVAQLSLAARGHLQAHLAQELVAEGVEDYVAG